MPKKTPKNAFFYFMLDFKRKEEQRGQRFAGLGEVSAAASPQWNKMTAQQKGPYERQAKNSKVQQNQTAEQYSCLGVSLASIDRARAQADMAQAAMKTHIDDMVKRSYMDNTITTQQYYFIASNHFCKTLTDEVYTPAELAIVRYSLASGCEAKWHTFVNPGVLPIGYAFDAQEHSKTVHGLQPPPRAQGEANYTKLLSQIIDFVGGEDGPSRPLVPLFAEARQMAAVRSIVDQLCVAAGREPAKVLVYPLVRLFHVLKREAKRYALDEEEGGFPSEHVAQAQLDRDPYDHRTEIACGLHAELDRAQHCALSMVTRYAFILSDHICLDLAIDLIPGKHVPADADIVAARQHKTELDVLRTAKLNTGDDDDTKSAAYTQFDEDEYVDDFSDFGSVSVAKVCKYSHDEDDDDGGTDVDNAQSAAEPRQQENPWIQQRYQRKPRPPLDESLNLTTASSSVMGKPNIGYGRGRLY